MYKWRVCLCEGVVVEGQAAPADHHAHAAGAGATGGEDLHRQVRAHSCYKKVLRLTKTQLTQKSNFLHVERTI